MIDAHLHFWDENSLKRSPRGTFKHGKVFQPSDFKTTIQEFQIEGAIVMQTEQSENDTEYLLSLASQYDFIKGVIGWIDLRSEALGKQLHYYKQFQKLKGFRLSLYDEDFTADDKLIEGIKLLGELGYTFDLMINHTQLEQALSFIYQVQEATIVIDHIAKPSIITREKTHWELNMAALSTFKNVYCKLSGLTSLAEPDWTKEIFFPYLDELMECFGPSRLIYGSDWPFCMTSSTYQQQLEILKDYFSQSGASDAQNVFGVNAQRAYKI